MALSEAYAKHPQHLLSFDAEPAGLRVRLGDQLIAETTRGILRFQRSWINRFPSSGLLDI